MTMKVDGTFFSLTFLKCLCESSTEEKWAAISLGLLFYFLFPLSTNNEATIRIAFVLALGLSLPNQAEESVSLKLLFPKFKINQFDNLTV